VLLHEIAHWLVDVPGKKVEPHGQIWQDKFRELMQPIMVSEIFSESQLQILQHETRAGHTGACFSPRLKRLLDPNAQDEGLPELLDLPHGAYFYHDNRPFLLLQKRRSRAVCLELIEGRNLLVNMRSIVKPLQAHEIQELDNLKSSFQKLGTLKKNQSFIYLKQPYILLGPGPNGQTVSFRKPRGRIVYSLSAEALVKVG
jgi:hypothetical protein